MEEIREGRIRELVRGLAAEFFSRESNRTSLITVTNVHISPDGKTAIIFFTVLPEDKQKAALDFAKRMRSDFRDYVKEKSRLQRLPFFDFEIDTGEKNRQRIDELSNS
jgi:ribosome-binding factor A